MTIQPQFPAFAPLPASATPAVGHAVMPADSSFARIREFKSIYVGHTQVQEIEKDLRTLLKFGSAGSWKGPSFCYLLTGETGWGKSTVLRKFADMHPVMYFPERNIRPVLYLELRGTATTKRVAIAMLGALGVAWRPRATEQELTQLAAFHLRNQGVKMVILDEAQNFVDQAELDFSFPVAEWLKGLLNEGTCSFVFAGMPVARLIYGLTQQLERRSFGSRELRDLDFTDSDDFEEFQAIAKHLLAKLPLAHALDPEDPALMLVLHACTHGRIGILVDFLAKACIYAMEDKREVLERVDLADTAEKLKPLSDPKWKNPFLLGAAELLTEMERLVMVQRNGCFMNLRKGKRKAKLSDVFVD